MSRAPYSRVRARERAGAREEVLAREPGIIKGRNPPHYQLQPSYQTGCNQGPLTKKRIIPTLLLTGTNRDSWFVCGSSSLAPCLSVRAGAREPGVRTCIWAGHKDPVSFATGLAQTTTKKCKCPNWYLTNIQSPTILFAGDP